MLSPILRTAAHTRLPILLTGETGTGKSHTAYAIHRGSPRARAVFVVANIAAINPELFEAALFGHVKGAFTGAGREKLGLFREADGGTLFLDELGELPPHLQAKLLTAIESGTVRPVGADADVRVNVRVIAATHSPHKLRDDLRERFWLTHHVTPLRERGDLLELAGALLAGSVAEEVGIAGELTAGAAQALKGHDWPGNIRELASVLARATLLAASKTLAGEPVLILDSHVEASLEASTSQRARVEEARQAESGGDLHVHLTLERPERAMLRELLASCEGGGTVSRAKVERTIERHTKRTGSGVDDFIELLLGKKVRILERVGNRYRVTSRGAHLARAP